jgi:hypothetical protein
MPATFTLEIRPERAPEVLRVVEMAASATLDDLHYVIQKEFHLDNDHLYAFFLTNKAWAKNGAFMSDEGTTADATLRSLDLRPGKKFLYLFDFGDELRHEIRVRRGGVAESSAGLPRVVESVGKPPPQFVPWDDVAPLDEDLRPLAEEAASATKRWDEAVRKETDEEAPLDAALVDADDLLARRLVDALRGRPAQLESMVADEAVDIEFWLTSVPFELARLGRTEEALTLWAALSEITGEAASVAGQARILARAGRAVEARARVEALLQEHPDDPWAADHAADVFVLLGDYPRAEDLSRTLRKAKVRARAPEVYASATERLADLLKKRGEEAKASALTVELEDELGSDSEAVDDDDLPDDDLAGDVAKTLPGPNVSPDAHTGTVRRDSPKVGRNEPCPCGSGKKYKKCHG